MATLIEQLRRFSTLHRHFDEDTGLISLNASGSPKLNMELLHELLDTQPDGSGAHHTYLFLLMLFHDRHASSSGQKFCVRRAFGRWDSTNQRAFASWCTEPQYF